MSPKFKRFYLICSLLCAIGWTVPDTAEAFTRGLTSKVRLMQRNGYTERLSRAEQAYKTGDYKVCVQEAQLALQHARSDEQALPVRKLLAAAHTKLGNRASASPHLKWLAEHGPSK